MAAHPIVHVEIPAKNTAAAAKFYADAFGWGLQHDNNFDYWMFTPAEGPGGGFVTTGPDAGNPTTVEPGDVLIHISSDDIEADLAKVESLGGKTQTPKTEIPQVGWWGVFIDPTGNKIALFTAIQSPGAGSSSPERGAVKAGKPIEWLDIPAKDTAAAAKFYEDAFGWGLQHDDNFDYWMFSAADGPGGGFVSTDPNSGTMAPQKPGEVLIYIGSDDVDADLAKVESLGGKTVVPKTEIPGMGWWGAFTDPTGNKIGLFSATQPSGG